MTEQSNNIVDRIWSSGWCILFGHDYVGHTRYRLESDTGRALYGDLCPRCGKFNPRGDAKEEFENPMPTDIGEILS